MNETQYEDLLAKALNNGEPKEDRTGTGTLSLFGERLIYDLAAGFPLITTKRVHFKSVVAELLWMLSGSTNVRPLQEQGVTIWNEWADRLGNLGPVYGAQWRGWLGPNGRTYDQMAKLVHDLRRNPNSRRHIVSAWNVAQLNEMALAPCHVLMQLNVCGGRLDLQVYQRSADLFLGAPFNIASYALLTHLLAAQTDYQPGRLIWVGGDVHLYRNHIEQAVVQLGRQPYSFPQISLRPAASLFDYTPEHIELRGYLHHPVIKAEVAV